MTQLRLDAVDILAFLASRNPEGFRALVDGAVGVRPDGKDSVTMAECAAAAVEAGVKDSPESLLTERFGEHMRFLGRIERTTRKRCDLVMSALFGLGADVLDGAAAGDEAALSAWTSWVGERGDQFGQDASAILSSWKVFRGDLKASEARWDFTYAEVNRGQPVLGQAADLVGGRRWDAGASVHPEVVLVNLPFSPFVGISDHDDPAVSEVVGRAAVHLKKCKAALFKVEWSVASRLGLSAAGYEAAVAKALPKHQVGSVIADNERCSSVKGRDLYVAAAAGWTGEFSIVTVGSESRDAADLPPPADSILPIAERVLRGLLRSVELN